MDTRDGRDQRHDGEVLAAVVRQVERGVAVYDAVVREVETRLYVRCRRGCTSSVDAVVRQVSTRLSVRCRRGCTSGADAVVGQVEKEEKKEKGEKEE